MDEEEEGRIPPPLSPLIGPSDLPPPSPLVGIDWMKKEEGRMPPPLLLVRIDWMKKE